MGEIMKRGIYLSILLVVSSVLVVDAATTSNLAILGVYEDRFANYDLDSKEYSPNNVDWPVTMVFWKNADVNKVKSIFFGQTILAWSKYGRLNDSDGWIWDEDRGTKGGPYNVNINGTNFTVYLHMRVYAPNPPDYMNNSGWGRYVLATTHYDEYPWEGWSGYSELAEKTLQILQHQKATPLQETGLIFTITNLTTIQGIQTIFGSTTDMPQL